MDVPKLNIAVLAPSLGIGGCNRKYYTYYKYLDKRYFRTYYFFLDKGNKPACQNDDGTYCVGEDKLCDFLEKHDIKFLFLGKPLNRKLYQKARKKVHLLISVTFLENYIEDERALNLFICKTDHYRFKLIKQNPINAHVLYDPIDVSLWRKLRCTVTTDYRYLFKNKKIVVGRLARAEPSKWNFLIIRTLIELDRRKDYSYGFLFVGMPVLYRKALNIMLSKKMLRSIILLPEMVDRRDIAKFYKSIDVFWQTSKIGESFGDVIGEAYSFEVPVVTDYKNFFRKDGTVNTKLYNAQTELVDDGVTGAYCNYPSKVIDFLENSNKSYLRKLGKNGLKKTRRNYDAKIAGITIAGLLYTFLKEKGQDIDSKFIESINIVPSEKEVAAWGSEYHKRLNFEIGKNNIPFKEYIFYRLQEIGWAIVEFKYLVIRKILRGVGYDLEVWKHDGEI